MFKWLTARRERREQFCRAMMERMELASFAPTVIADDVLRIIQRDFPDAIPNEVLAELRVYGPAQYHFEEHRVHAAILKLSNGERERIGQFVQLADKDFRDVLTLAEMPGFSKIMLPVQEFAKRPINEIERITQSDRNQYLEWFNRKDAS
jgi:hypothetical protein